MALTPEDDARSNRSLRATTYSLLTQSTRRNKIGRWIDIALMLLITLNVLAVILETVPELYKSNKTYFIWFELFSVAIFSVEYLLRLWCCVENENKSATVSNSRYRLKYLVSPMALIDLVDLRFIRVLRLLRIFKLTRYSAAMTMLLDVLREEASALLAGIFIMIVLLVLVSSGAYVVEQSAQPELFGSIPDAMWWAVATLTTVGYGDVTPITPLGKIFGACVTIIGIGMAALPAGILANGLADQLRRLRKELGLSKILAEEIARSFIHGEKNKKGTCPQCGYALVEHS